MTTPYTEITFPGLGLQMNPSIGVSLGILNIRWYGMVIACGILLAVVYACCRAKEFGITVDDLTDGILVIVPVAILCARAYYCIFNWSLYRDHPISCLYIWEGGLAIYGAVLGAIGGIIVFCKVKKISIPAVLDLVMLGFLIGQAVGRWGNFFNREAFGSETENFLRMGLLNPLTGVVTYHHPTFLYESMWNLAGLAVLHFVSKKRKFDGEVALGYAVWYGLGRAWIEGLRTDSLYIGATNIRVSQLLAVVSFIVGGLLLVYLRFFRENKAEKLFVNRVAAKKAEAENKEEEV